MNTQCVPWYLLFATNPPGEGIKRAKGSPQVPTDFGDFTMKFLTSWLISVVQKFSLLYPGSKFPEGYYFYYLPPSI